MAQGAGPLVLGYGSDVDNIDTASYPSSSEECARGPTGGLTMPVRAGIGAPVQQSPLARLQNGTAALSGAATPGFPTTSAIKAAAAGSSAPAQIAASAVVAQRQAATQHDVAAIASSVSGAGAAAHPSEITVPLNATYSATPRRLMTHPPTFKFDLHLPAEHAGSRVIFTNLSCQAHTMGPLNVGVRFTNIEGGKLRKDSFSSPGASGPLTSESPAYHVFAPSFLLPVTRTNEQIFSLTGQVDAPLHSKYKGVQSADEAMKSVETIGKTDMCLVPVESPLGLFMTANHEKNPSSGTLPVRKGVGANSEKDHYYVTLDGAKDMAKEFSTLYAPHAKKLSAPVLEGTMVPLNPQTSWKNSISGAEMDQATLDTPFSVHVHGEIKMFPVNSGRPL
jgi:hypothetical protein